MNRKDLKALLTQMSVSELQKEKFNIENKITQMVMLDPDELEKLDLINTILEDKIQ